MIQKGTAAPVTIPLTNEQGETFMLGDYAGQWIVMYFYPKDNTPGCTIEAEEFRDRETEFKKKNAAVIGVSKDSCSSHQKFIAKKNLPFTLVADTEHVLMEAFGTWGERTFMGKKYMGTSRSTFLINPDGVVAHVWESVRPAGHPDDVLAMLDTLQRGQS